MYTPIHTNIRAAIFIYNLLSISMINDQDENMHGKINQFADATEVGGFADS